MFGFRVSEVTAGGDRPRINIRHIRGLAIEANVLQLFVSKSRANGGAGSGADFIARGALVFDGGQLFRANFPVLQGFDDDVEVGHREWGTRDLEDVGAEVGDLLFDIAVGALHDSHDGDERGHSHRQSEHGQQSAQLVSAEGGETLGEIVAYSEHEAREDPISSATLPNTSSVNSKM